MSTTPFDSELERRVHELVRRGFKPSFGQLPGRFGSHPLWRRLWELGTELWVDSGDIEAIGDVWTREFSALTTNNTLLNKEIQKGTYDDLIVEAAKLLADYPGLTERDRRLELAFILNARHGLRLVESFGAYVSVEEHTELADDVAGSVRYARRFQAVCPERFYVKIPFSPAGVLATRLVSREGIPVNHTLGFSARQNYLAGRVGRPEFVNVFLGRLNAVVADNGLGGGDYVGENATLGSQDAVRRLRQEHGLSVRQIGASLRDGRQVRDLAGIDVMTMPPKVAKEFIALGLAPGDLADKTGQRYRPGVTDEGARQVGLDVLWEVERRLEACVDALEKERLDAFSPDHLMEFMEQHGCGGLLVRWPEDQVRISAEEGKIPKLDHWGDALARGTVRLDSLMNLAGWNSFDADQREMDRHVQEVLGRDKR